MDLDDLAHELAHDFVTSNGSKPSGAPHCPKRDEAVARIQAHENSAALAIKVHSILYQQAGNGPTWAYTLERLLRKQPTLQQLKAEIIEVLGDVDATLNKFRDGRFVPDMQARVQSLLDAVKAS